MFLSQRKKRGIKYRQMAAVEELIRCEEDGTLSFGNHVLSRKAKKEDFEYGGDLYKVKTFGEITKLEKNGMFVYESVPGTSVNNFSQSAEGVDFTVEGGQDVQITLGLADDTEYEVFVDSSSAGTMRTNLGGKLCVGIEMTGEAAVRVSVKRV